MNSHYVISQYFKGCFNIERQQDVFETKELIKTREQQLMVDYVIVEKQKKLQPKSNYSDFLFLFQHILDPQNTPQYSKEFKENFAEVFNEQMKRQGGWKKIYFELYEIVEEEMKNKQNDDCYFDCKVQVYTYTEISRILEKILIKIQDYNRQLALIGLIFTTVGERYLCYFSLFIIWRFICFKKWKNLKAHQEKIEQLKSGEFEKFQVEIFQNKQEISIIKGKRFVETIVKGIITTFIKDNVSNIKRLILSKKKQSYQIINNLDEELLISQKMSQKDILEYLQDQRKFIELHV